jgi:hypothetical protein
MVVFLFLWHTCYMHISKRYIIMDEDDQGGGVMDLGATPMA